MNSHLICGQEEPLRPNRYLLSLNEETSAVELDRADNDQLNRYSFVWFGALSDASERFALVLRAVALDLGMGLTWLLAWEYHPSGQFRIRSLSALSRRRKEEWSVYHDQELAVASKEADHLDTTHRPESYHWIDGGLLVLVGHAPPPEVFAMDPLRASIKHLARDIRLSPSVQFLNWLVDRRVTIAYEARDTLGRSALIMVGAAKIPVSELVKQGAVNEVRSAEKAATVWRFGPSWPH